MHCYISAILNVLVCKKAFCSIKLSYNHVILLCRITIVLYILQSIRKNSKFSASIVMYFLQWLWVVSEASNNPSKTFYISTRFFQYSLSPFVVYDSVFHFFFGFFLSLFTQPVSFFINSFVFSKFWVSNSYKVRFHLPIGRIYEE